MASVTILSDNGATSGSAGLKTSGGNDGVLLLQTTTSGGTPTTAISISNTQVVTYTNQPTYTGGTANGVLYLNGSKAVTSGTALVFDGSNLGVGTSAPGSKLDILNTTTAQAQFSYSATIFGRIGRLSSGNYEFSAYENGANLIFGTSTTNGATTERMRLDSSGNLGLGVTPSAWWSTSTNQALQTASGSVYSKNGTSFGLGQNVYASTSGGGWKYVNNGYASLFDQDSSQFTWYTAASGTAGASVSWTQAMTLNASGNLALGQSTPISGGGSARWLTLGTGGGTSYSGGIVYAINGTGNSYHYVDSDGLLTHQATGGQKFLTNNTERVRITSGGRFLIGTTTSTYPLYVNLASDTGDFFARFQNTNASSPYGLYMQYSAAAPNNSVNEFIYCGDSSALRMSVRSNGGIANYTANNSPLSDRRLKKDIKPAGSYLEKICAIPVVTYLYNDQTDDLPNLGVIAQDVQAAAPELCNEEGWGTKAEDGTNYLGIWETDIQYALMKCIQEQQTIIEQLRADVQALKGQA